MGGCYSGSYGYSECNGTSRRVEDSSANSNFKKFMKTGDRQNLVSAYKSFFNEQNSGVFAQFAEFLGIKAVEDIPKEFPETEYEVKFDVQVSGKGKEPEVVDYLDAFDFPASKSARFLKDPVNSFSIGVNNFYGDGLDERLVVIEKGGRIFLKEKGLVSALDVGVKFQDAVIKRSERRYEASFEQATRKVEEICSEPGIEYRGKIRKEKGDVFMLDANDGRIYSFTITRAHLIKPGETKESGVQRQLEIEYAGYFPGFKGFKEGSEKQIVQGMVDIAKYTYALYDGAPVKDGWAMNLAITGERKYDFINSNREKVQISSAKLLTAEVTSNLTGTLNREKVHANAR